MGKFVDLTGQKFGMLTVIQRYESTKQGKTRWVCQCDCGKIKAKPVVSYDLINGKVKSCGCLYKQSNKDRNKTHGLSHSRIHFIWSGMIRRCKVNPLYVSKNITVCEQWKDFSSFYTWATENGYAENLTIDRIDNNKGYYPNNCRWASMKIQQNNRTNNRIVNYKGLNFTVSELADELDIPYATLLWRINNDWEQSDWAITPNLNNKNLRSKTI